MLGNYVTRFSLTIAKELANALASAQPKIQKMCEEDSEDHEAVAKLFEINDSIHRTIERYKLIKKGDVEGANKIPVGTLGRSGAGVSQGPNNTLNLIDFGDPEPAPPVAADSSRASQQPAPKGNALEDDLLGLSLSGDTYGQSGSISLGGSNGSGEYSRKMMFTINANRDQFWACLECLFRDHKHSRGHLPNKSMISSHQVRALHHLKYHHPLPLPSLSLLYSPLGRQTRSLL